MRLWNWGIAISTFPLSIFPLKRFPVWAWLCLLSRITKNSQSLSLASTKKPSSPNLHAVGCNAVGCKELHHETPGGRKYPFGHSPNPGWLHLAERWHAQPYFGTPSHTLLRSRYCQSFRLPFRSEVRSSSAGRFRIRPPADCWKTQPNHQDHQDAPR